LFIIDPNNYFIYRNENRLIMVQTSPDIFSGDEKEQQRVQELSKKDIRSLESIFLEMSQNKFTADGFNVFESLLLTQKQDTILFWELYNGQSYHLFRFYADHVFKNQIKLLDQKMKEKTASYYKNIQGKWWMKQSESDSTMFSLLRNKPSSGVFSEVSFSEDGHFLFNDLSNLYIFREVTWPMFIDFHLYQHLELVRFDIYPDYAVLNPKEYTESRSFVFDFKIKNENEMILQLEER
jgi:hypothetical protein